MAEQGLS
jgi:Uncharacterised protein family UPF0564